jgi:hypothetical protein
MKSVAGTLKLDLAQFRELEAFATFGSELDAISKAQLERGYRLVELLKQPLNSPMPVEEQVLSIYAGTKGHLDDVPVGDVRRFESELIEYVRTTHSGLLADIKSSGIPDGLDDAIVSFKQTVHPDRPTATASIPPPSTSTRWATRSPTRPSQRSDLDGWRSGANPQGTHSQRSGDEEDHARHGADRGIAHRQGPGPRAAAVPYSEQITEVVKNLAGGGASADSPLLAGRDEIKRTCYVVITADRGLCGGYNSGVQRAAEGEVKADVLAGKDYTIIPVGRKAESYFRFRGYTLGQPFNGFSDQPELRDARRSASTSSSCSPPARSTRSSWSTPASSPPAARKSSCARSSR